MLRLKHATNQIALQLTHNIFRRINTPVKVVYLVCVAQLGLHLVIVLLVRHTETVSHLHDSVLIRRT